MLVYCLAVINVSAQYMFYVDLNVGPDPMFKVICFCFKVTVSEPYTLSTGLSMYPDLDI